MSKPINFNKPVQTRDGRKVEILRTDVKNKEYPVVGIVTNKDDTELAGTWNTNGRYLSDKKYDDCSFDLVNIVEKKTGYLVVYPGGSIAHAGNYLFSTLMLAENYAGEDSKVIPIEYDSTD